MHGAMVGAAEYDEAVRVVIAALGARLQVVHIDEMRVLAARNDTAPVIAPYHLPSHGGWNVLGRSPRDAPVGVFDAADALGVTLDHLHDLGTDVDELAACLLRPAVAAR